MSIHRRSAKVPNLGSTDVTGLAAFISVIDEIPIQLLTVDAGLLTAFTDTLAVVRYIIDENCTLGNNAKGIPGTYVTTLRQVLKRCPDHALAATVATLALVPDQPFRDGLDTARPEVGPGAGHHPI